MHGLAPNGHKRLSRRAAIKALTAAGGLVVTASLLQACAPSATPTAAPSASKPADGAAPAPATAAPSAKAPAAGTVTEITYWASWTGLFEEMVKRIASAFMAKNPDIKVNHLVIPATEMDAKILTGVAAGNPPDVAMIWGAQRVYSLADQGALQPLEDSMDKNELLTFKEWVHPPIWELGTYKGKTFAIPQWCQSYCVIWNKAHFAEAGLDPNRGPQTTQEMFEYARKLTKKSSDGTIEVIGYFDAWMNRVMSMFHGQFYDEGQDKITLDHPNNVEALDYILSYTQEYDPKRLADYRQALKGGAQGTLHPMLAGKEGFRIEGPWDLGVYKETKSDFEYGVAPLPVVSGKDRGWWTYGDIPSIIKNSKHLNEAARYVTFLTGFGGEEEYASLYLMPPTGGGRPHNPISKKLIESAAWKKVLDEYPGYDQYMITAFGDETKYVLTPPKIPVAAFLNTRLTANVDAAILGEVTATQALATAQKEAEDEYLKYKQSNP